MIQVIRFLKCKKCNEIHPDYKWIHTRQIDSGNGHYIMDEKFYCPYCLHTEYNEVRYEDLSYTFRYNYQKENLENQLESFKNSCESPEEFYQMMESLGWKV